MAKLETSVSLFSDKLELKVYGFNHKLPILLSKVLAVAKSFSPTDDRFKVCKVAFASSIILIPGFTIICLVFLLSCHYAFTSLALFLSI